MREEIIASRERSKKLECEVQLRAKRSELQRNQWFLDQKKQKLEMARLLEEECRQAVEFHSLQARENIPGQPSLKITGEKPKNLNQLPIDLNPQMGSTAIVQDRVADWVSLHSQASVD